MYGAIKAIRCSILHDRTEYLLHHTTKDHIVRLSLRSLIVTTVLVNDHLGNQLCGVKVFGSIKTIRGSIPSGRTQYPSRTAKGHIVGLSLRSLIVITVLVTNRLVNQLSGVTVYVSIEAIRGSIPYGRTQYPRRTTKGHIVGLSLRSLIVTTVLVNNRLVNQLSGVTVYGSIEAIRGSIPYGHTQYPRRTTKGHIVFGP